MVIAEISASFANACRTLLQPANQGLAGSCRNPDLPDQERIGDSNYSFNLRSGRRISTSGPEVATHTDPFAYETDCPRYHADHRAFDAEEQPFEEW